MHACAFRASRHSRKVYRCTKLHLRIQCVCFTLHMLPMNCFHLGTPRAAKPFPRQCFCLLHLSVHIQICFALHINELRSPWSCARQNFSPLNVVFLFI